MTATEYILPWHAELWAHLARGLGTQRVAHGLLIAGPRGVGKRRLARRLMASLLCRTRTDNQDACGQCLGCRQRAAGTHPDLSFLTPESQGKTIKVAQVRQFSHSLHLTPQYDSGRIGWIDPADALSISAANSLLKTLEEPPAGCHIILVSDRISALLPTIRSRCQRWTVPTADPETAGQWLRAQAVETEDIDADRLRTPLTILAQREADNRASIAQWDRDLARLLARRANPVSLAERFVDVDRRAWLDWLCRRCNRLLQESMARPDGNAVEDEFSRGARRMGPRRMAAWSRQVADITRRAESNADWRLMVESLLIALAQNISEASDP